MFADRVVFIKDVRDKCEQNEICEWGFYWRCHKLKSIDCIAIHYSSEKRLIKVEFPESKIHEEMLFLLSISDRDMTDAEILDTAICRGSAAGLGLTSTAANVPVVVTEPEESSGNVLHEGSDVANTSFSSSLTSSSRGGAGGQRGGEDADIQRSGNRSTTLVPSYQSSSSLGVSPSSSTQNAESTSTRSGGMASAFSIGSHHWGSRR